jgi:hypothetical protein
MVQAKFVVHPLRHIMLTCLVEAGAQAFAIMKIASYSVIVSQPPITQRFDRITSGCGPSATSKPLTLNEDQCCYDL